MNDKILDASKAFFSSKDHKDNHYNDEDVIDYKVSTGSLKLDYRLGGGLGPGIHRFCGVTEGGKTSEMLQVAACFQQQFPDSLVWYYRSEGRFSPKMRERAEKIGIDFDEGRFQIVNSNVFECVGDHMQQMVDEFPKARFLFLVDSMDGLIPKGDREKKLVENAKVAGGALLASLLMKKLNLPLTIRGHMAILSSQVRSKAGSDQGKMVQKEARRQTKSTATGGNALDHFANIQMEYLKRGNGELILEKDGAPDSEKNKILGHKAKVLITKSDNETTGYTYTYPIKYEDGCGRIWREMEIVDAVKAWDLVDVKGAWYNTTASLRSELEAVGIKDFPEKFQGEANLTKYLEENSKTSDALYNILLAAMAT